MRALLDTAIAAAEAAGRLLAARSRSMGEVRRKGRSTDLVTDADVASGVEICRMIAAEAEGARFVVEEPEVCGRAGVTPGTLADPEVWVIDPLDGTTSFVHGYPCWSVSVALLREGEPVLGVVRAEPSDETYAAAAGLGATLNGAPVSCSQQSDPCAALLGTGFPYDRGATLDAQLRVLARFLRLPVHDIRRDGSAAIDCCHVACGRTDAFWEFALQPWDTAAGVVIAREAGALVTDLTGAPWRAEELDILIANPALHPLLLAEIAEEIRPQ
ncbi:MAG: inositol monophosphatase [Coriobacteriaceae bacterium]|nr:inositol monophosphatase [Coriobacteriaceae bacterium]